MIFQRVVLQNIFSYYGEISLDFAGGSKESNIALVSGRNGYGKTSFLRSIKMLFSGTEENLIFTVTGRKMGPKQFVTGDGKTWLGIMNRKAVNKNQVECRVRIDWDEEIGRVTAIRSWNINEKNYLGDLEIKFSDNHLKGPDARDFLDQRLPSAYIPFFFFDSEQIEKLADSTDEDTFRKDMERLLDIAPIDLLRDELKTVAKEWQRDSMEKKEQLALLELQHLLEEKELAIAKEHEKIHDLEYKKEEIENSIQGLEKELTGLENLQGTQDFDLLQSKRDQIKDNREKKIAALTELIQKESPILANPDLVLKTTQHLEQSVNSKMGTATEILKSLKKSLNNELFDEPPYPNPELYDSQKKFLKNRLVKLIDARIPDTDSGFFASIDSRSAKQLYNTFVTFKGMNYARQEIQRVLSQVHELTQELAEIDFQMVEATGLSDEERNRIDYLKDEVRNSIEKLGAIKKDIELSNDLVKQTRKQIEKIHADIRNQEKAVDLSKRARKKVNLARDLRYFFDDYKKNLRKLRREDVEAAFNKYLKILMPDHQLVNRVIVSDSFSITYLNKDGDQIGHASFSSGMKQLIATALLWALKTVSGKNVPVIIDTPLGRLDADHQTGILKNYYPKMGSQVILLPTDSELDEKKYRLIQNKVYKEYRLQNDDGETTQVEEIGMYPAV